MKILYLILSFIISFISQGIYAQIESDTKESIENKASSNFDLDAKAKKWVHPLELKDEKQIDRVEKIILNHLIAVKTYHDAHSYKEVPEGINPKTGDKLNVLDRTIIAHSAKPSKFHEEFVSNLRANLSEEQVISILDMYTVGKVDFTMKGYQAIVPDLTDSERKYILKLLEEAREKAVDYKNMEEISAIFEIYKTKAETFLNSNGRDWRQLYKDYINRDK